MNTAVVFFGFCTSLRHALHPDITPIYLWTSHKCSGSSAFSQNIYLSISLVFFGHSTHSQDMYYIYFRHFRHLAPCPHLADASDAPHFFRTCTPPPGLYFLDIPDTPRTCSTFGIFILDISDIQKLIYVCTCSGSSTSFQEIYPSTRAVFFLEFQHFSHPLPTVY